MITKKWTDNNQVNIKMLNDLAKVPTRGSDYAAGYDLYAATEYEITVPAHTTIKVGTGLAMELPYMTFGAIIARSGLATKQGLRPANCTGVVDSDYRGEIMVALHNHSDKIQKIEPQERIAQLVVTPFLKAEFVEAETLGETARGEGGFGSTGTK
jgi:dUTP pyrophosphatase